jgi:GAF domain-containing protein
MHGAVEIRVPIGKGLSGTVAADGKIINIAEAYHDDRFNQAYDKKSGYRTKTILCHPIRADTGAVIGVVQLINKAQGDVFDDYDEEILASFLEVAGRVLQHAQIFTRTTRRLTEFEKLSSHTSEKKSSELKNVMGGAIIEEGDEEEEEEDDDEFTGC